jgi:predicted dehydrogenase
MRTVLIGAGKIGIGDGKTPAMRFASHAAVLRIHPAFRWEAVVDPSPEARRRARECWGVRIAAADMAELLAQYEPEVAVLATPPGARLAAIRQLTGLRGVLVEKPLALTYAEAHALVESCDERAIPLQVNFLRRADERMRALAAGDLAALIGKPECVFGVYGRGLRNNGVHMVDLVRMLLGEVESVEALGPAEAAAGPISGDVHVPFLLRLQGGISAILHPLGFEVYRENGLDIWGRCGRLSILEESRRILLYAPRPHATLDGAQELNTASPGFLEATLGEAFYRMYDNLADAIAGKAELWSSGRSALATERIVEAASHGCCVG